jgi:CheY-like chemotaxis protein
MRRLASCVGEPRSHLGGRRQPAYPDGALDLVVSAGFEGVGATCADEAIAILEARADIRLVFTDVEMPGTIDGVKLAHHIRNRWPPIRLIVASGRTILEESQLPTGSKFFSKPYDNNTIAAEMTRMLGVIAAGGSEDETR